MWVEGEGRSYEEDGGMRGLMWCGEEKKGKRFFAKFCFSSAGHISVGARAITYQLVMIT